MQAAVVAGNPFAADGAATAEHIEGTAADGTATAEPAENIRKRQPPGRSALDFEDSPKMDSATTN